MRDIAGALISNKSTDKRSRNPADAQKYFAADAFFVLCKITIILCITVDNHITV